MMLGLLDWMLKEDHSKLKVRNRQRDNVTDDDIGGTNLPRRSENQG